MYGVRMQDDAQLAELAKLYPTLSPAQLAEAAENLDAYLRIALQIWERIENDPGAEASAAGRLLHPRAFRRGLGADDPPRSPIQNRSSKVRLILSAISLTTSCAFRSPSTVT
jgi:hypothetical protein